MIYIISALMFLLPSVAMGATLYMPDNCANLQACFSAMSGGDTLIIRDGTYTGTSNMIDSFHIPKTGSSGAWTTIKAEHDGEVLFDGQDANNTFYVAGITTADRYWQFEGIVWGRSSGSAVLLYNSNFVKFFRCGAYDAGPGNTATWAVGRYGSDILLENCYSWGGGRYKFEAYQSSRVIFRSCVARSDIINAPSEPSAQFSMYSCEDCLVQNSIAIDSDQTSNYSSAEFHGPFIVPSTDMDSNNVQFINSIGLNIRTGGLCTTGAGYAAYDTVFNNVIVWDASPGVGVYNHWLRGVRDTINHCTLGAGSSNATTSFIHSYDGIGYNNNTTLKNTLIYGVSGTGLNVLNDVEYQNNNSYYGITATLNNAGNGDITNINPIYNSSSNPTGALRWLPKIESSSSLYTAADDGGSVGARVMTLIGTPGTLYGETGYNTDTGVSMWPYPYESLIKTKFSAYSRSGVNGARGFAASGKQLNGTDDITLTSYIWEYLGNEMPTDIYGTGGGTGSTTRIGTGSTTRIGTGGTTRITVQ